jgi:hypothetical protein
MVLGGGGPLGAIIGRYPSAAAAAGDDEQDPGPGGSVIRHDRKCRDWPFLFLFAAFWVAMIVNSSFGFNQGNPLRCSLLTHTQLHRLAYLPCPALLPPFYTLLLYCLSACFLDSLC